MSRPLPVMWRFARDWSLRATVRVDCGRRMTAVDIQRWYLERVAEHLGKRWMPSWASRLCEYWKDTLDRLEEGPEAVATRLDWAIKLTLLFRTHLEARGLDDQSLRALSTAARMRDPAAASAALQLDDDDDDIFCMSDEQFESIRNAASHVQRSLPQIRSYLKAHGLTQRDLAHFERIRREVFEIDALFSQITGKGGIFGGLDAAGLLEHKVPEVGDPQTAMFEPPPGGRAARRAAYIRSLHKVSGASCCRRARRCRRPQ